MVSGEGAKASTILEKLDPMTVIGSAIVRMPEIITTMVTALPSGVTWLGLELGFGRGFGFGGSGSSSGQG